MKKIMIISVMMLVLVGCGSQKLQSSISEDKFNITTEIPSFDVDVYINLITPILDDLNYIRLDSVFLDGAQTKVIITNAIVENIISIYNEYEENRSTFELINFLDLHIKKISKLDVDILLFKIISRIEADYELHNGIVSDEQFNYLMVDYISRITDTFIDNYDINEEVLVDYPDMASFLDALKKVVNGGYQIRRFEDEYYMFPDYASILVRYKDYYSDETKDAIDVLVRESRNIVLINGVIQMDNEAIAYKVDEIEAVMKKYPNSVYYPMLLETYLEYFTTIVNNPNNIEEVAVETFHYKEETIDDLHKIINRYSDSQMARLLTEFTKILEENEKVYDEVVIVDMINKINSSY